MDWKTLGLDPAKATCTAPEIKDFQAAAKFSPTDEIPVPPGRGWLLILTEEPSTSKVGGNSSYRKTLHVDYHFGKDYHGRLAPYAFAPAIAQYFWRSNDVTTATNFAAHIH